MEITKTLTISADEFYTQLMNSVIFDIRKQTGKTLTRKQLRKFEYIKEYSKNSRAKIVIEEAVPLKKKSPINFEHPQLKMISRCGMSSSQLMKKAVNCVIQKQWFLMGRYKN